MNFASALRSVLRQDPNVLMLGEIRDPETADIAMQAALTGHLILTTVHADGAAGPFARLIDMKSNRSCSASGTIGSLSQRLVRTLCPACRVVSEPEPNQCVNDLCAWASHCQRQATMNPRAVNCAKSEASSGARQIAELLIMTGPLRDVVHQCQPTESIRKVAFEQGMVSLLGDGLRLAAAGETSLTEVLAVGGRLRLQRFGESDLPSCTIAGLASGGWFRLGAGPPELASIDRSEKPSAVTEQAPGVAGVGRTTAANVAAHGIPGFNRIRYCGCRRLESTCSPWFG